LLKEAMNVSKVIYDQTDKINNSIIASILSLIVLIATTIVRSLENITMAYSVTVISVFFVFSAIYYFIMQSSSQNRYKLTRNQFLYFIKEVSIIQNDELKNLQSTYLEKPFSDLKNTLNKLLTILLVINLFLMIFFGILA
jgi:hypothetical protein